MTLVPHRRDLQVCEAMGPKQRSAWIRILSAIQTSETMEFQVLDPLLATVKEASDEKSFLEQQSRDEKRHGESIRLYLLENFGYEKRSKTLSDRIFYSIVFPLARRVLFTKVGYAFAILLFYERFSVGLYAQLLKRARNDQLLELVALVECIVADEAKHIRGLKRLLKNGPKSNPFCLKWLLWLVSKDVSFERWAFHNRDIRKQLKTLDIDPERINRRRKLALIKVAHDCAC